MSLDQRCNKCGDHLHEFGGLMIGPPYEDGKVVKWHLCRSCYQFIISRFYYYIDTANRKDQ